MRLKTIGISPTTMVSWGYTFHFNLIISDLLYMGYFKLKTRFVLYINFIKSLIWRHSAGCVTYSWCVCLFCFTGFFGFWIPFCIDSCYDTEVMCSRCGFVKGVVPGDCCWNRFHDKLAIYTNFLTNFKRIFSFSKNLGERHTF
jgi:hypothetical protein